MNFNQQQKKSTGVKIEKLKMCHLPRIIYSPRERSLILRSPEPPLWSCLAAGGLRAGAGWWWIQVAVEVGRELAVAAEKTPLPDRPRDWRPSGGETVPPACNNNKKVEIDTITTLLPRSKLFHYLPDLVSPLEHSRTGGHGMRVGDGPSGHRGGNTEARLLLRRRLAGLKVVSRSRLGPAG